MTTYFENKEHYLNFRQAWADAVNSEKAKPTFQTCGAWIVNDEHPHGHYVEDGGRMKVRGWITGSHVILYNILRGKHPASGFMHTTNKTKLINSSFMNLGFQQAAWHLNWTKTYAEKCFMPKEEQQSWIQRMLKFNHKSPDDYVQDQINSSRHLVEKFLEPFGGTVTVEMFHSIPKVEYEDLWYDYGIGKKIYDSGIKFKNLTEMMEYADKLKAEAA